MTGIAQIVSSKEMTPHTIAVVKKRHPQRLREQGEANKFANTPPDVFHYKVHPMHSLDPTNVSTSPCAAKGEVAGSLACREHPSLAKQSVHPR